MAILSMLLIMATLSLLELNKRKTILYLGLLILIISLSFIKIYYTYYYIDFSDFAETKPAPAGREHFSPNGEYSIRLSLVKLRDKENEHYILGELTKTEFISEGHQIITNKNTRIVYWDKQNTDFTQNLMYVSWLDNTNFQINGKKLNIFYKAYDYRRDYKRIINYFDTLYQNKQQLFLLFLFDIFAIFKLQ